MISAITWSIAMVLFLLSGLHMHWVLGGRRGTEAAIPSTGSDLIFRPSNLATGIVALLLALSAWFVLELGGAVKLLYPDWIISYGGWLLSAVFIIRAIGDFKWMGFFKRKKGTVFARWDSAFHSPLCLLLGIGILVIALNH